MTEVNILSHNSFQANMNVDEGELVRFEKSYIFVMLNKYYDSVINMIKHFYSFHTLFLELKKKIFLLEIDNQLHNNTPSTSFCLMIFRNVLTFSMVKI